MSSIAALLLLAACKGKPDDTGSSLDWSCEQSGDIALCDAATTSGEQAVIQVDIDVEDERSFLLTAVAEDGQIAVEEVIAPDGTSELYWDDWVNGEMANNSLTFAFWEDVDTVMNWPIREVDGDLATGTYTVVLGTYTFGDYAEYKRNVPVDITLHRNRDADLDQGAINALVVYADGLDSDPEVTSGTEAAVEVWKEIWGAVGMDLTVTYETSTLGADLPWPGTGGSEMLDAAGLADGSEITVIVGETIDGSYDYLGVSGNVPGTLIPTSRTGTVVSWLANAGLDATFDEDEIRTYGETLAHEVGHYIGLFHPVEDGYDYWDALDDTVQCTSAGECESVLGENLMYPWPVCNKAKTECLTQSELTNNQSGVMQRYSGTL